MMLHDCPAYLADAAATRCGLQAEVRCVFTMSSIGRPLASVMIMAELGPDGRFTRLERSQACGRRIPTWLSSERA
jgi:hypothetical protein